MGNADTTTSGGRSSDGDYRIKVQDFGPIARGNVEFRPLTVFLGPGNTGKSYLATLGYALHRHFAAAERYWYGVRRSAPVRERERREPSMSEFAAVLDSWASTVTEDGGLPALPARLSEYVRQAIARGVSLSDALRDEIIRVFGADRIGDLVRYSGSGTAKIELDLPGLTDGGTVRYRMRIERDRIDIEGEVASQCDPLADTDPWVALLRREALRYQAEVSGGGSSADSTRSTGPPKILQLLVKAARDRLISPLLRRSYYLPAERTGMLRSHKTVGGGLAQGAAAPGRERRPNAPMLSGVLTDFMEELTAAGDRNTPRRHPRIDAGVAAGLDESVLEGTVRVEPSDTDDPRFLYRPAGWDHDLALTRSSATVAELAPLVFYLRHVVGPGDVLIIEEPESHLHPAMQVEVIGWLARTVRAGVRVIVTTHSEWILDGLANIVLASTIAGRDPSVGDRDLVLDPGMVGVWRFRTDDTGGAVIEEAEIDDSGKYPAGFDAVAVGIHNRWTEIESHIDRPA